MKLVIHSLQQINNVEIFPIISFIIFFIFFLVMGYRVYKTPKSYVDEMGNLPLDKPVPQTNENENQLNIKNPN